MLPGYRLLHARTTTHTTQSSTYLHISYQGTLLKDNMHKHHTKIHNKGHAERATELIVYA